MARVIRLRVTREQSVGDATPGSLAWSVDGLDWTDPGKAWMPSAYTLEDQIREIQGQPVSAWKVHGKTAIPMGIYDCEVYQSPRFTAKAGHPVLVVLIKNVPGFTAAEIHGGNWVADTDGCILAAWNRLAPNHIQGSAQADVVRLLQKHGDGKGQIQIIGPYANQ